jgi:hypothetical protein
MEGAEAQSALRYADVAIPEVSSHSFETLLIAFLMLLAGNLFKGF